MPTMEESIEANRVALWETAQAQSQTYSERSDQVYSEAAATRPEQDGSLYWDGHFFVGDNGSSKWSGSVTPGTFSTNGQPPSSSIPSNDHDGTGGLDPPA